MIALLQADAMRLPIADHTVDLIVTSPPYFGLRSYQDQGRHMAHQVGSEATPAEFVDALIAATREMIRVVKPTGSIWVNLGDKFSGYTNGQGKGRNGGGGARSVATVPDGPVSAPTVYGVPNKSLMGIPWRYAIRCIDELGLILRAEVIWSKPNGLPESVTDRVRRSHEQWFHFTAQPRYYAAVDEIREEYSAECKTRGQAPNGASPLTGGVPTIGIRSPLGKLPGSVWTIATQPLIVPAELGVDHFAAFPMEWPRRIIKGWSPSAGTVLDPFGGTGTTALMAGVLGRTGISVDMSADYCRLATWRTADPKQRAKAAGLPFKVPRKPRLAPSAQLRLFDDEEITP